MFIEPSPLTPFLLFFSGAAGHSARSWFAPTSRTSWQPRRAAEKQKQCYLLCEL